MKNNLIKRSVVPLFLTLVGILFSIIVFEIGIRIIEHMPKHSVRSDRPPRYFYSEASASNRDYLYTNKKPSNTYRIVVIGDSFTFGFGVAIDDTFPKRLERLLNLNNNQPKVEVINLGVPGLSTFQEVQVAQRALANFAPDLVLLQITLNDPEIKPYLAPRGTLNDNKRSQPTGGFLGLFHSINYISTRIENKRSHSRYIEYFQNLWQDPSTKENFENGLSRIAAMCMDAKVPMASIIFPLVTFPLDENKYPFSEAHSTAHQMLDKHKVLRLDLLDAFRGMDVIRLQAEPGVDPHPSEIAHRIAAENILKWLHQNSLIPSSTYPKLSSVKRTAPRKLRTEK